MRYDVAYVIKGLMDKVSALSDEAIAVDKISLEDSDLEGLRGKVGDRFIVVTKDMIKESINRDIGDIQQKLEGYICDSAQHTRECIRIACNQMVDYMLKKHFFAEYWYDLSKAQQEACLIELNKRVDQAMKDITGMPGYEERAK